MGTIRTLFAAVVVLLAATGATEAGQITVPGDIVAQAAASDVRIFVRLNVESRPEGELTPAEVELQRARIQSAQDAVLSDVIEYGLTGLKRFTMIPFFAAQVSPAALERLSVNPLVAGVEEDTLADATLIDSTPLIGATTAWNAGVTGSGWSIAVLDTGVDRTHPFLAGKVVSEACFSTTGNVGGVTLQSACPGGAAQSTAAGSAAPCAAPNCFHGTHVAGIAAGSGTAFSGVARGASIIAIQVFSVIPGGNSTSLFSDVLLGLQRVATLAGPGNVNRIAAVNMSLGTPAQFASVCDGRFQALKAGLDLLRSFGIAPVVAAGNSGNTSGISSPACISSAVSVGATTKADGMASFSNRVSFLSLVAPGAAITSSVPGGGFQPLNGTSMAAPHVAGAFALMRVVAPTTPLNALVSTLQTTGKPITGVTGAVYRRIDLVPALRAVAQPLTPAPWNLTATLVGLNDVRLTWNAPTTGPAVVEYALRVGLRPGAGDLGVFLTGGNGTSYTARYVPNGGPYYIAVIAVSRSGPFSSAYSPPSNEVAVTVSGCTTPPPAPVGLVLNVSAGTVYFGWLPTATAESYTILIQNASGGAWQPVATLPRTVSSITQTAPRGLNIWVSLVATNRCGTSPLAYAVRLFIP